MTASGGRREQDLATATLEELRARHPTEWERTSEAILASLSTGRAEEVAALVARVRAEADHWRGRLRASGGNPSVAQAAFGPLLRERMTRLALERTTLALAARETQGTVRLDLWSGTIVQKLFFGQGLERKAASLSAFKLLWPLVRRKRLVMPLLQQRGIYCLYSRALVRALVALVAGRPCLEIAAGDGALSRLLTDEGLGVTATDDGSWSSVALGAGVERLDARTALRRHPAPVVLCSWPPAGNEFERTVFDTPGVELYVVLGSRHRFASGDWAAYERQRTFDWTVDERLSRLVLPPEIDPAVLVFGRRR